MSSGLRLLLFISQDDRVGYLGLQYNTILNTLYYTIVHLCYAVANCTILYDSSTTDNVTIMLGYMSIPTVDPTSVFTVKYSLQLDYIG